MFSVRLLAVLSAALVALVAGARAADDGSAVARLNHLAKEKSPYLLQHATNPVDWYPWDEAAIAKARAENKPIFLSIGYSTCHWCHVMARESFADPEVARLLNEHFVSIKVDREERPDVDQVYMAFVQATTGGGGWPLTVVLTPELQPFFGGTYYPPDDRRGRPGLKSIAAKLATAWRQDAARIRSGSTEMLAQLRARLTPAPVSVGVDGAVFDTAYRQIAASYDATAGGFGPAPKFPRPANLHFLFQAYARGPQSVDGREALRLALATLREMGRRAIHDQVGGGFHRYTTDAAWQVPHFEKMLGDQAQLALAYLSAYQITREPEFAEVARATLDFVQRELAGTEGGFLSALDAESPVVAGRSEKREGAYYTWTQAELSVLLGADAPLLAYFGVTTEGNAGPEFAGLNTLGARRPPDDPADPEFRAALASARPRLLSARSQRPRPHCDDKVITAWNGLMISAFARGAQVLGRSDFLVVAEKAADFLQAKLWDATTQRLHRTWRDGARGPAGFADDHAFLVQGLLDLYEAGFEVRWLDWAQEVQAAQDRDFWDEAAGGYFGTTDNDASILLRMKEDRDGAEPSPNSIALLNLLRWAALFDDDDARDRAGRTLQALAGPLARAPATLPQLLVAADWLWHPPTQVVIAGTPKTLATQAMLAELHRHFLPRKVVILADGAASQAFFAQRVDFFRQIDPAPDSQSTAYLCTNFLCQLPMTRPEHMGLQLEKMTERRRE
ncbi:MAG: Thioredoxin protein [Verrucomicrobiota bacterium]|nr:Thioredoxin protein [Verrucomicrobiota bacterium]